MLAKDIKIGQRIMACGKWRTVEMISKDDGHIRIITSQWSINAKPNDEILVELKSDDIIASWESQL